MSVDEFDPYVERLFAQAPVMPDAALFKAGVETRLHARNRLRSVVLSAAGLLGGVIAVRELMALDLRLGAIPADASAREVGAEVQNLSANLEGLAQSALAQLGLSDATLGSMGAMQMFWVAAAAVIALAAAGAVRLSQDL